MHPLARTPVRAAAVIAAVAIAASAPSGASAQTTRTGQPGSAPATARGKARPDRRTAPLVAVLPLATDDRTAIYSVPVAGAIAKRLRRSQRYRVELVSPGDAVPARVDLVIDGSIASAPGGDVVLSVRVRDPEVGTARPAITSRPAPLAEIDALAGSVGDALEGELEGAAASQRERRAADTQSGPIVLPEAVIGDARRRSRRSAAGPPLVVFTAAGQVAGRDLPVARTATAVGLSVAYRLGFRPVAHAASGIVEPGAARRALAEAGARWGLMLEIRGVAFEQIERAEQDGQASVLSARCRFRVVLIDAEARAHVDAVRRTDTVVGSRGDQHAALLRFALAQVGDIAYGELKRALGR